MKNILTFLPLGFYFTALPGYDMIEVANFEMTQEHAGMKFLILSLGTGGGHNTAANAVKQALIERGDEAQVFDCLAIVSRSARGWCAEPIWALCDTRQSFSA